MSMPDRAGQVRWRSLLAGAAGGAIGGGVGAALGGVAGAAVGGAAGGVAAALLAAPQAGLAPSQAAPSTTTSTTTSATTSATASGAPNASTAAQRPAGASPSAATSIRPALAVAAKDDPSALRVENLVMVRGTKAAVNAIELTVARGRITALMGANGAGKTSTVLGISGVIEPAFGEIWLEGTDLAGLDADDIRRRGIATVPEGHQVLRELTVRDNLLVAGGDLRRGELSEAFERTLTLFPELKERLTQPAGELSGGQQQMVALAQAMVVPPKFLVIDELSFGLAPLIVARLVPVIRRIAAGGVGVLLIEQFTHLALALADHVYVMSRGTVSYDGEPGKLRADPDILHQAYFPVSARESVGLT